MVNSLNSTERIDIVPKTKHGKSRSRLYHIWTSMKQRCANQNAINFEYYGGKGISVCDEWKNDFKSFYEWAMANGYSDDLTIERINNNQNYCPENCRWATNKEQQNHTSYNSLYTYNGETHSVMQWAEKVGISANMLYKRLHRGWDIARALTTPKLRSWGK